MEEELKLPAHITPCAGSQPTWYYNSKSKKYIHADRIKAFLEAYWSHRQTVAPRAKVSAKNNLKQAQRRWDD